MSDLPKDVIYDDLTEAYIVDLGDDTVAEVMGRRRGQKAIELSNMLAENARLEAQLAETREENKRLREALERIAEYNTGALSLDGIDADRFQETALEATVKRGR